MFMRLVTPSTRRLLDGVGRDGRANVKVFARCKRAINDVHSEGVERHAPRDGLVETERRAAVGARDHKYVMTGIFCLVARSQHGAQLASSADGAALRGCNGCEK